MVVVMVVVESLDVLRLYLGGHPLLILHPLHHNNSNNVLLVVIGHLHQREHLVFHRIVRRRLRRLIMLHLSKLRHPLAI